MSKKEQPDRVMAFFHFCVAQMCALMTGLWQLDRPDRSFPMFLVVLIGSTVVPAGFALKHLRPAWMSEPDTDGYPGLRS